MVQQSRRIGAYEVQILHDGVFEAPLDVLIHADGGVLSSHVSLVLRTVESGR